MQGEQVDATHSHLVQKRILWDIFHCLAGKLGSSKANLPIVRHHDASVQMSLRFMTTFHWIGGSKVASSSQSILLQTLARSCSLHRALISMLTSNVRITPNHFCLLSQKGLVLGLNFSFINWTSLNFSRGCRWVFHHKSVACSNLMSTFVHSLLCSSPHCRMTSKFPKNGQTLHNHRVGGDQRRMESVIQ